MTKIEFLNKVTEIYFRDNCNIDTAIQTVIKESNLTVSEYEEIKRTIRKELDKIG